MCPHEQKLAGKSLIYAYGSDPNKGVNLEARAPHIWGMLMRVRRQLWITKTQGANTKGKGGCTGSHLKELLY